jgi:hypothetical protein
MELIEIFAWVCYKPVKGYVHYLIRRTFPVEIESDISIFAPVRMAAV